MWLVTLFWCILVYFGVFWCKFTSNSPSGSPRSTSQSKSTTVPTYCTNLLYQPSSSHYYLYLLLLFHYLSTASSSALIAGYDQTYHHFNDHLTINDNSVNIRPYLTCHGLICAFIDSPRTYLLSLITVQRIPPTPSSSCPSKF